MSASRSPDRAPPSLLATTVRRGLIAARLYFAIGIAVSLLLTVILLRSAKASTIFVATFPLEVPIFAALGAMGGMMLFVSDRSKGVLEYLISYGVRPVTLFVNCLLATLVLSTLILAVVLTVGLVGYSATGHPLTTDLTNAVLGYTLPMTYASAMFETICGIVWSALSTPRMGVNSPVGVAPMLGVAPPILVLIVAEAAPRAEYYDVTVAAAAAVLVVVLVLLLLSARLMGRERYLSPL